MMRRNRSLDLADIEANFDLAIRVARAYRLRKPEPPPPPPDVKALKTAAKAMKRILTRRPYLGRIEFQLKGDRTIFYFQHGHTSSQALLPNEKLHDIETAEELLEKVITLAE